MTTDAVVEQTCLRCGSDAAGAPWCPACGLNLRTHAPQTAAPPPPSPAQPAPYATPLRDRSRGRRIALIAGLLLVLGGAIAAVALLAFRSSSSPSAVATSVVQTVAVTTQRGGTAQPLVAVSDIHDVLVEYVNAYSNEDAGALGSLFASDFVRRNGNGPFEDRDAALATYQSQFDQVTNPHYTLTDLQYGQGRGEASATGTYVITSAAGETRGAIEFHFVVRDGRLLIDGIQVVPS